MTALDFAFYPRRLELRAADIGITTLPAFDDVVPLVRESPCVDGAWFYAPPQQVRELHVQCGVPGAVSDTITQRPYSTRVFGLRNTHRIEHASSADPARLRFLMHCFGFFEGMRMDDTRAGFLDATPIERGTLTDFVFDSDESLGKAMERADQFWMVNEAMPRVAAGLLGVLQSLSLSSYPQALQFEQFIWAYTAIEGAFAVGRETCGVSEQGGHRRRIENLCTTLGIPVPRWATDQMAVNVVGVRNDAIHEGMFLEHPLGFHSFHGVAVPDNERHVTDAIPFAMRNFVCRVVLALLGIRPGA